MLMGKMGRSHDITLTPRDFNYDNHHYQYLKYTKRGKVSIFVSYAAFPLQTKGYPHGKLPRETNYVALIPCISHTEK